MNITIESNPSDAPCCVKIVAEDGRNILMQTDWDWPGVASTFGFSLQSVQKCDICGEISTGLHNQLVKYCRHCQKNVGHVCSHDNTDGTVKCTHCGIEPTSFIQAAREWMDENDGAQAEDPGYFVD